MPVVVWLPFAAVVIVGCRGVIGVVAGHRQRNCDGEGVWLIAVVVSALCPAQLDGVRAEGWGALLVLEGLRLSVCWLSGRSAGRGRRVG